MKVAGPPNRIELKPENDAERDALQKLADGTAVVYYGDSDHFAGGAVIVNTTDQLPTAPEPACAATAN